MFFRSGLILTTLKVVGLPHVLVQILGRLDVDLRGGQKGIDADADDQTAFHLRLDPPRNDGAFVAVEQDVLPVLLLLGLVVGNDRISVAVLEAFKIDFDFAADVQFAGVAELNGGDGRLGFAADIDDYFGRADLHDPALDDFTLLELVDAAVGEKVFH